MEGAVRLRSGNPSLDQCFILAQETLAKNIHPFRDGLLAEAAPVIIAGGDYDTPWTRDAAFNTVVLVGATNLALYDVYAEYTGDAPEDGARTMSYKKFKKLTKHLLSGSSRSKLILETAPEKLHSVGIAAVVAKTLIKRFGAENIVASDRGVKEGYLELALAGKLEGAFYDFSKGGSFETVVKSTAPAAPAKRGRKPAAKEAEQTEQ